MSVNGLSNFNADVLANNLATSLTAGMDLTLPALDLSSAEFTYPAELNNPLYANITRMTEADLTTRVIGGAGIFDGMMAAMAAHLQQEYSAGRISGSEYSTAYVQMATGVLGSSVNFLLAKDQAYWQAHMVQMQARTAEIAAVNARLALEITRAQLATARVQLEQSSIDYAVGKMKLSNMDVEYALGQAQLAQVTYTNTNMLPAQLGQLTAQNAISNYQLSFMLPKELEKITKTIEVDAAQIAQITAQTGQVTYQTTQILPAQKAGIEADTSGQLYQNANTLPAQLAAILKQTETAGYQLTYLLPKEVDKATKAIELTTAQISQIAAQKDQVLFQTSAILPSQNANIQADTGNKVYQTTTLLPAQVAGITADTTGKIYSNTYLLPANLATILENNEGNRAKTLDTRTDGITPIGGLIGKQKQLYDQQIGSYKRADEAKVAKMYLDAWITQKSMDEGLVPPTSLTDSNINTVLGHIRTNADMV